MYVSWWIILFYLLFFSSWLNYSLDPKFLLDNDARDEFLWKSIIQMKRNRVRNEYLRLVADGFL